MLKITTKHVEQLLDRASLAKCHRDSRAALVVVPLSGRVIGQGTNGPPGVFTCDEVCRGQSCRKTAEHAEAAAIRCAYGGAGGMEIIHANTTAGDAIGGQRQLVTSRPPSVKACASCAVTMVAAGVAAIWLFVEPGEWRRFTTAEYYQAACRAHAPGPIEPSRNT